jgi:UDP-2,3-diacylglucosamine hydrolase
MNGSEDRRAGPATRGGFPIGIVSGGGSLPFAVADAAARHDRRAILFALRGCADAEKVAAYPHHWIGLGQIDRLCRLARQERCDDLVFIGTVVRPAVRELRLDLGSLALLPRLVRIFRGGDGHLLAGVAGFFEQRGFRVVGAHEVAPEILVPEGALGRFQPNESHQGDIALGLALLRAIGQFDVGQATIVAGGHVLAVEAAEGTDEMLAQVAELRRKGRIRSTGGVLVKAPKPDQDRRIDLPTIGPQTIAGAARAGLAGIAVVAGEVIMAEPDRVMQAADGERIFVVGLRPDRIER